MKLLIVEDEVRIANNLKKGFVGEAFDVDVAYDGDEGLNHAIRQEYDLVILDIMLPKINGLTILRKMREKKIFTPVIMLTAKDSNDDIVEGLEIGADDYLAKPFSFEVLLARVRALIRRSTTMENVLSIDSLVLDPKARTATRDGKEIELSSREFKILEYLMLNKGFILSAEKIVNHIWNYDTDVYSNVVAAHIKNLRKKVDKNFPKAKALIKTVRGMGYKIHE
jgi:two-component system, OmpR family, response regulator